MPASASDIRYIRFGSSFAPYPSMRSAILITMLTGLLAPTLAAAESTRIGSGLNCAQATCPYDGASAGIDFQSGYENPLGPLGVAGEFAPLSWLSIAAGAGLSIDGLQLGTMARFRYVRDGLGISLGWGLSTGNHLDREFGFMEEDRVTEWDQAVFANLELASHFPLREGGQLRFSLGRRTMVDYADCSGPECSGEVAPIYFGIGFSWPIRL